MENGPSRADYLFFLGIGSLILLSIVVLRSIAPFLFPLYFFYLFLAGIAFFIFYQFDFEVVSVFSKLFYVGSIIFLILPIIIGQVTRGTIRWIPLGPLTIQPAEIVRPFLLVFFANYLTLERLTLKRFGKALVLLALPLFLILVQPSLGVTILTFVGFVGVLLASNIEKKNLLWGVLGFIVLLPVVWMLLAPYQKERVMTFLNPSADPYGKGYNAIQSMISVGSGKIFGRGLGKGVGTQLAFLPERHTDFIFASVGEELGLVGSLFLILGGFFILSKIISIAENSRSPAARAYISGLFLAMFVQMFVHIGMNLGLLPITGIPFPLVSAGGSSLLATMIGLAIALGAKKV